MLNYLFKMRIDLTFHVAILILAIILAVEGMVTP